MFVLIHTSGLWDHLSDECKSIGEQFLQLAASDGIKINAPQPIGLSLSLSEYMNIVNHTLNLKNIDSSFWQIVIKIQYLMMSIEKDPMLAQQLKLQTPVGNTIENIFGE